MKFNLRKWQGLQERKQDLHRKLMDIQDDRLFSKEQYNRLEGHFIRSYESSNNFSLRKAISADRKLSHTELTNRIQAIKKQWPSISAEFSLGPDTRAHLPLMELYDLMLDLKKLEERNEKAQNDFHNHAQSFIVLEEFASQHAKTDQSEHYPPDEPIQQGLSSELYPLA